MKVGLVVGVKCDNSTLREYVEHYIKLGFSKIILFDNNDIHGENPLEVIHDLKPYLIYIDHRGDESYGRQLKYYTEAYLNFKDQFDALAFFDSDEYLFLNKHSNISDYLSEPMFKDADCVHINWKMYGDNGLVHPIPGKSTFEQFPNPCPLDLPSSYNFPINSHVKTIVFCKGKHLFFRHPHFCSSATNERLVAMNASGHLVANECPFVKYDYEYAELRHYQLRTTEEFCNRRLGGRGRTMFDGVPFNPKNEIDYYFKFNERTPEKEQCIRDYCKQHGIRL